MSTSVKTKTTVKPKEKTSVKTTKDAPEEKTVKPSVKTDEEKTVKPSVKTDEEKTVKPSVKTDEEKTVKPSVKTDEEKTVKTTVKTTKYAPEEKTVKTSVKTDEEKTVAETTKLTTTKSVSKPATKTTLDKLTLFTDVSDEWLEILDTKELDDVVKLIDAKNIVPPQSKIFEFARLTELNDVKVVILGQDPYPRAGDAHGLAFSCLTNVPASLKNVYKCLVKSKLIKSVPYEGDLSYWAGQGVLLLNCALTTAVGEPGKHTKYWKYYTDGLIETIAKTATDKKPVIFMLWGKDAKEKRNLLDGIDNVHVLEWAHPSPLAQQYQSFTDCDHFIEANNILRKYKLSAIDWNQTEPPSEVEKGFDMNKKKQIIFTDGSCNPNKLIPEAKAGYATAFVLGTLKDTILYGSIQNRPHYASNQRAEGYAIYKAMELLKQHIDEWDEAVIVTDSDFWINTFLSYMPSWKRKGMDFTEKKNSDLTIPMWDLYTELNHLGKEIEFRHIRSHGKSGWGNKEEHSYEYFCYLQNQYVDELASYARTSLEPGVDVVGSLEYEDDK